MRIRPWTVAPALMNRGEVKPEYLQSVRNLDGTMWLVGTEKLKRDYGLKFQLADPREDDD